MLIISLDHISFDHGQWLARKVMSLHRLIYSLGRVSLHFQQGHASTKRLSSLAEIMGQTVEVIVLTPTQSQQPPPKERPKGQQKITKVIRPLPPTPIGANEAHSQPNASPITEKPVSSYPNGLDNPNNSDWYPPST